MLPANVYQSKHADESLSERLQIKNIKSTVCVDKATNNRNLKSEAQKKENDFISRQVKK